MTRRGLSFRIQDPPAGAPPSLTGENLSRWWLLYRWANGMRGLFGVPIYLCGSALRDDNPEPRDWDVRLMLPARDFLRRYGSPQKWEEEGRSGNWSGVRLRWSDECVKYTKHGWRQTRLNIDFQVYPIGYARRHFRGQPRLRIDTFPGR